MHRRAFALALGVTTALASAPLWTREPPWGETAAPALASLIQSLSEPGGYFDTDNLISNETSYLQVADALETQAPHGGAYLGVGPDQNFSYIARVRPEWAFIVDIRRGNMLEHLFFAAALERAPSPYAYLCRLLGRACADGAIPAHGIDGLLASVEAAKPSEAIFERNLADALAHIEGRLGLMLSERDRADLRGIARAFFEEQLDLRFHSHGRPSLYYHPTYRTLLRERSPDGRYGSFLASAADYAFVRELSRRGRLVPVVGDFAGPKTLRAVGGFLRERGVGVSAFYVSNVEYYLLRDDSFERFAQNVRTLPASADAVFIRAYFDYGRAHPSSLPGRHSATVLQRIPRFLAHHAAGDFRSYWDVSTLDVLR